MIDITQSNIFGNEPGTNCGIDAVGGSSTALEVFWGAPGGPGGDPADLACNTLPAAVGSPLDKPVRVKSKPLR